MTDWAIRQTGWASLHARVRRLTRRHDSEDLLQTALLHILERGHAGIANTEAYVLRTARNLAIDEYRRERRDCLVNLLPDQAEAIACPMPLPDAVVLGRQQLARLSTAFAALEPRTARIFLMHRLDHLPYRTIAAQLGVSVSTIEKQISKALCVLTTALLEGDAP
ncbi:RNA polymerase sigma factor [Gluconacetobacter takamatsuzukensis]|uniref:Sigma-70 family RNA polymerase sigma factor n=1 Tax=Gluconacetobacter takamatsuzukensis TaxID=1286190 RepID=A0A7W4KAR3_9PROT|nr:sigma-70 family RNA polymerase sigma factor [Gluconacetobacter takamatsuzukensis]MBB2203473.1 sigma-70 family RNA polymerase sigma factor [Gluconacetobacter takamatsuzukensis]